MKPLDLPNNKWETKWNIWEGNVFYVSTSTQNLDSGFRRIVKGQWERHNLMNLHISKYLKSFYPKQTPFALSRNYIADWNPEEENMFTKTAV